MSGNDLWKKYCSFYEKSFSEQLEYNRVKMKAYFEKWKKTDLAKTLCKQTPKSNKDVPPSTYSNYTMMTEFATRLSEVTDKNPRGAGELLGDYYLRVSRQAGAALDRYMVEPFDACTKTTGSTGASKWIAYGETFSQSIVSQTMAIAVISCSDEWGATKLKDGDAALNLTAPVPYISGWGAMAFAKHFRMIPPMEVTDNISNMRTKYSLILKAISKGEKIDVAGGIGSMFYMICKYFVDPEELYSEYYRSMRSGLKKSLLALKLLQCKLSKGAQKKIIDYLPLKGVAVGGIDSFLYIDFFKKEFNLDPLHLYGSTEAGNLMKGDPDRKSDLVPNMEWNYLEFRTEDGSIKELDELKKGETYDLVVTPFGSILFRYDMEDLFRVVDFRDDGMPVFAFEGRKSHLIDIYGYYRVTPNIMVQALSRAGLKSSDKWAVVKMLEPNEHLCILMEKPWSYSEKESEQLIFDALKEVHTDFRTYVTDFKIENPSDAINVEYLRPGAFLRYSALKAKMGSPIGQYKPPQMIPPDRMEIYETLRSA